MDFMQDTLADGRAVRILTVIDVYTRECMAVVPARTFGGADVVQILRQMALTRARPKRIRVDNVLTASL
jgi:putative transposase